MIRRFRLTVDEMTRKGSESEMSGGAQTFPVTGVIKGWTEALQQMPVGSKWELFIPSELAYGPNGKGPIEPNSTKDPGKDK